MRQRNLNHEAATWLFELQDNASQDAQARFRRWLEVSADHIQAFLEVAAVDLDLDGMDRARRIDIESLIAQVRAEGSANIVSLPDTAPLFGTHAPGRRRLPGLGIAAAAAFAIAATLALWMKSDATPGYTTAIGEQRVVKLDDGSLVQLNTRSRIEIHFSDTVREVKLLEGEALFTVERDAHRPFRVLTRSTVIQAVGTQFNVYRRDGATTVSVIDGRVKVSDLLLEAGEAAQVHDSGHVARQPEANIANTIAWRQRQLSFDHTPLGEVAEEFNRYNKTQIRIADPSIRAREMDGVFDADQPMALMDFLSRETDLAIERREGEILIRLR